MMAYAEKTTTKPIKAAVIRLRAFSVPSLSPPARIHCRPPQRSQMKAIRPARTKIRFTPAAIKVEGVHLDTLLNWLPVGRLIEMLFICASVCNHHLSLDRLKIL